MLKKRELQGKKIKEIGKKRLEKKKRNKKELKKKKL